VGKTFAVRQLGKDFPTFIEINFEKNEKYKSLFDLDLDPKRILRILSAEFTQEIVPGKCLLFFDEIQEAPRALTALRYFFEEIPELHVIAAGSLLSLAIGQVGVPVGRISFCHIYPMSWLEFLKALGNEKMYEAIISHDSNKPMDDFLHQSFLEKLSEYLAIGGMPAVVQAWVKDKDPIRCANEQQSIIATYKSDFPKYAKKIQIKYVETVFSQIPQQLAQKFKFSNIPGEYRKRELIPALDLLSNAHVAHIIYHSGAQGLPLRGQINFNKFKTILVDIGISQAMLGAKISDWLMTPRDSIRNRGAIVEAFVGQELLAYSNPFHEAYLHYWHREAKNSQAEVDYVIQEQGKIIPIGVKSQKGKTLRSMDLFLESHQACDFGIRVSEHNFSSHNKIISYPLYAIANLLKDLQK